MPFHASNEMREPVMADEKQRPDAGPPGEIPGEERAGAEQPTEWKAEADKRAAADAAAEDATAHPVSDSDADAPVRSVNGGEEGEKDAAPAPEIAPAQESPASESQEPSAAPARRRTPWFALLLAGLVGGAVVAAAASYVWFDYTEDESSVMSVLWARLGAVELAVQDLSAHGSQPAAGALAGEDQLAARVAKLEASIAAASAAKPATTDSVDASVAERLTGLEAVVKSLAEVVARLDRRSEETAAAVQAMRTDAAAGLAPGQQASVDKAEFESLSQRVAALQQSAASLQQSVERSSATLQQSVARGGAEAAAADRAVRLAVVASGLRSAVQRGAPFAGELGAAKALVPDPQALAPLEPFAASGVPSAQALGREFLALAPKLAQTAKSSSAGDYVERLLAHAERLVRIRPVNEAAGGDDTSAVVARAETKAEHADIAGVLAELGKLPESARGPAADWMKKAEAREAAVAAAQRIENAALAALAKP
jgi:hypothetical protein